MPSHSTHLKSLTIVLPCFNEDAAIRAVVHEAISVASSLAPQYEVIIVNDGSQDNSRTILDDLAVRHICVRVIHHDKRRGYGAALRSGFALARYDWVFYTDADGQYDLTEISKAALLLNGADIVVGYRDPRSDSRGRRFNAYIWNRLVSRMYGVSVRDVNCAFKLLPRAFLQHRPWRSTGATVSIELIARAIENKLRIAEFRIRHRPRVSGRATGARVDVIANALWELRRV